MYNPSKGYYYFTPYHTFANMSECKPNFKFKQNYLWYSITKFYGHAKWDQKQLFHLYVQMFSVCLELDKNVIHSNLHRNRLDLLKF